jgi:hypothetical protein
MSLRSSTSATPCYQRIHLVSMDQFQAAFLTIPSLLVSIYSRHALVPWEVRNTDDILAWKLVNYMGGRVIDSGCPRRP